MVVSTNILFIKGSSATTPNTNREENGHTQQNAGQRNPATGSAGENHGSQTTPRVSEGSSFAGESGVRVVPIRTMVATVPGPFSRLSSDSSGNSIGLYYPALGRFQHLASGHVSSGRGSRASGEIHPTGVQTEQQLTPEPNVQQQNAEHRISDGNMIWFNKVMGITWLTEKLKFFVMGFSCAGKLMRLE